MDASCSRSSPLPSPTTAPLSEIPPELARTHGCLIFLLILVLFVDWIVWNVTNDIHAANRIKDNVMNSNFTNINTKHAIITPTTNSNSEIGYKSFNNSNDVNKENEWWFEFNMEKLYEWKKSNKTKIYLLLLTLALVNISLHILSKTDNGNAPLKRKSKHLYVLFSISQQIYTYYIVILSKPLRTLRRKSERCV